MTTPDTLNLTTLPFYQWDTFVPVLEEADMGVYQSMMDSIFREGDSAVQQQRPSLFREHTLVPHDTHLLVRPDKSSPSWTFVLLVFLAGLLCLYYRVHKITIGHLLHSIVDSRAMDRMLRGNNMTRTVQMVPMGLLLIASLALPVAYFTDRLPFASYLTLSAVAMLAYLLRNLLLRILGTIFDDNAAVTTYITNNYLYHLVLASVTIPLLFLFFYLPWSNEVVLDILAGLIGLEFVMRLFRGMKLFLTQSSNAHFYLFYYLCIVEIVPILVLIKQIID
ncbi:MAG: DUF4271 domain-containing protein [Bacteroidales bacterium]|nr:DUF4271 domain-containing protein [Bacteroidales bacterium]